MILSDKLGIPIKTEDLNLSVFNMNTGLYESKTLKKHISCGWKCKFDEAKCKPYQSWNNDKCLCQCKNYVWNPLTRNCGNGKYLASIMDDSSIICD